MCVHVHVSACTRVHVCNKTSETELIIRFVHPRGKAGCRTGYQGSEDSGSSESDQGRTKINKGDIEQEGEKKW